jgi:hypothetical protein
MQTWAARAASIGAAGLAIPSFSKKRAEAMGPAFGGGASSGEKGTAVGEPGGAGGVVSARGVDCGSGSGEPGGNQEGSKRHKLRFGKQPVGRVRRSAVQTAHSPLTWIGDLVRVDDDAASTQRLCVPRRHSCVAGDHIVIDHVSC